MKWEVKPIDDIKRKECVCFVLFSQESWCLLDWFKGYVSVTTTPLADALAEDSVVAKMIKLVEEAQNNKEAWLKQILDTHNRVEFSSIIKIWGFRDTQTRRKFEDDVDKGICR